MWTMVKARLERCPNPQIIFYEQQLKEDAKSCAPRIYTTLIFLMNHSLLPGSLAGNDIIAKLWHS